MEKEFWAKIQYGWKKSFSILNLWENTQAPIQMND